MKPVISAVLLVVLVVIVAMSWRFIDGLSADARGLLVGGAVVFIVVAVLLAIVGATIALTAGVLARRGQGDLDHAGPARPGMPVVFYFGTPPSGQLPAPDPWQSGYPYGAPAAPALGAGQPRRISTVLGDDDGTWTSGQ